MVISCLPFAPNSGRYFDTGSLKLSLPFSQSCMIDVAVISGFVREAMSKTVSSVIASRVGSSDRWPYALRKTTWPLWPISTTAPGTSFCSTACCTRVSIVEKFGLCATAKPTQISARHANQIQRAFIYHSLPTRLRFPKRLIIYPTPNVTSAPTATYQVQAIFGMTMDCPNRVVWISELCRQSNKLKTTPASKPVIVPASVARFVNVPSRNTPSIPPHNTEAMESPISRTCPLPRETMASASRIAAQPHHAREPRLVRLAHIRPAQQIEIHHRSGSKRIQRGAQVRHGSSKNRGNHQPRHSRRHLLHNVLGENTISAGHMRRQSSLSVIRKQPCPNQQKKRELNKDYDAARQQRPLRFAQVLRCEQTLNHKLIGPVAGHCEEASANHAGPEGIRLRNGKREMKHRQLSRCGCHRKQHMRAAGYMRAHRP